MWAMLGVDVSTVHRGQKPDGSLFESRKLSGGRGSIVLGIVSRFQISGFRHQISWLRNNTAKVREKGQTESMGKGTLQGCKTLSTKKLSEGEVHGP